MPCWTISTSCRRPLRQLATQLSACFVPMERCSVLGSGQSRTRANQVSHSRRDEPGSIGPTPRHAAGDALLNRDIHRSSPACACRISFHAEEQSARLCSRKPALEAVKWSPLHENTDSVEARRS